MNFLPLNWSTLLKCIVLAVVVAAGVLIVATQSRSTGTTFESCKKAGNLVQDNYPEVCIDAAGKRYINVEQDQLIR
jgi:hypothetical protein